MCGIHVHKSALVRVLSITIDQAKPNPVPSVWYLSAGNSIIGSPEGRKWGITVGRRSADWGAILVVIRHEKPKILGIDVAISVQVAIWGVCGPVDDPEEADVEAIDAAVKVQIALSVFTRVDPIVAVGIDGTLGDVAGVGQAVAVAVFCSTGDVFSIINIVVVTIVDLDDFHRHNLADRKLTGPSRAVGFGKAVGHSQSPVAFTGKPA